MKSKYLLLAFSLVLLMSCEKETAPQPGSGPNNPPPPPPPTLIKVKDVTLSHLPSPYYHLEYNNDGQITIADFSSGLLHYEVNYTGKNISFMQNNTASSQKDKLEYEYTNGVVTLIKVVDKNGVNTRKCFITYNDSHQLTRLDWEVKVAILGFVSEETQEFSYHPDGNVNEIKNHYFNAGSLTESRYTDTYDEYDNKPNPDGFSLIHSSAIHHLILLPAVTIQVNNAKHQRRTGDGVNFDLHYVYTYDAAGRPSMKNGDFVYTNGPTNGQHVPIETFYSYYN
jgi:hypothetical protein